MTPDPMKPSDDTPAAVRALLDALRRQRDTRPEPEAEVLRRWLDGTLPPERTAELDLLLADHHDLRVALATARLRLTDPVPADEMARLVALVPSDAGGAVVAFPAAAASSERRRLAIAAAIAALLLAPAWTLGTRLAQTQAAAEQRELRQLLRQDLYRGGF